MTCVRWIRCLAPENKKLRRQRPIVVATLVLRRLTVAWIIYVQWIRLRACYLRRSGIAARATQHHLGVGHLSLGSLFFLIFVALPTTLWLAWRRNTDPNEQHSYVTPFREWLSHPFVTWTGGISGREAAMQILLPIAAVAFGFGLVFLFSVPRLV
jgi:hypothetical protein